MSLVAWLVFAAFLLWVVGDGLRRAKGATDLEDYYAGGRRIPWWAAGLSVMATQASAITVIGTTGQGHEAGMGFLQMYLGLPFAMILLCIFVVPLYRKLPILTAYAYLEHRFGPATRSLASLIFLVSRCAALGVVIQAPAVVLSAMTGMSLTATILLIGLSTTLYTAFGGIHAVVWTDVKQMSVIVLGLVICFGMLAWQVFGELGFSGALRAAGAAGQLDALEVVPESTRLVPRLKGAPGLPSFWEQKYNLWSGLLGGLFLMLAYFGCDQSQVQRLLTSPSANDSRKTLLLSAFAKVPMQVFVLSIGVLLWLFHAVDGEPLLYRSADAARAAEDPLLVERWHQAQLDRTEALRSIAAGTGTPRDDAESLARVQQSVLAARALRSEAIGRYGGHEPDTNYVFPHWILGHLPSLLLGLVIAAIFAAAMSSADSALNSLSAATTVDFYLRYLRPSAGDPERLRVGRLATVAWGLFATLSALFLIGGGSIIEQINKVGSFFYGSLLGVFVLALLVPRAGAIAGFAGLLGGMASVLAVHLTLEVAYLWYNLVGVLGVLVVGLLMPRRRPSEATAA